MDNLDNGDNLCYLNVALQTIYCTPILREVVAARSEEANATTKELLTFLDHLFSCNNPESRSYYRDKIARVLYEHNPTMFQLGEQCNSFDALLAMLKILKMESTSQFLVREMIARGTIPTDSTKSNNITSSYNESWHQFMFLETSTDTTIKNMIRESSKNNKFYSLPHVLIIQVSKLPDARVSVTERLRLEIRNETRYKYRLTGIICHAEYTRCGGHYYGFFKDQSSDDWFYYNYDSTVRTDATIEELAQFYETSIVWLTYSLVSVRALRQERSVGLHNRPRHEHQ